MKIALCISMMMLCYLLDQPDLHPITEQDPNPNNLQKVVQNQRPINNFNGGLKGAEPDVITGTTRSLTGTVVNLAVPSNEGSATGEVLIGGPSEPQNQDARG